MTRGGPIRLMNSKQGTRWCAYFSGLLHIAGTTLLPMQIIFDFFFFFHLVYTFFYYEIEYVGRVYLYIYPKMI